MDGRYIRSIRRRFGTLPQKTVPNITVTDFLRYGLWHRIKVVPLLNYGAYVHAEIQQILERELGWRYYGGHHHECTYTHFIQAGLLPRKFNIDKRRLEYSALIRSGQKDRQVALDELARTPYQVDDELVEYCMRKLGLALGDYERILAEPPKSFRDYPTYYPLLRAMRGPIYLATKLDLISPILYHKYLG
jgi:hypothetical protein